MRLRVMVILGFLFYAGSALASDVHGTHGMQLPHSFLLPRAVPDSVGSYHLQLTPFAQTQNSETLGDVGAHASFGMFEWGGLHARSLGIKTAGNVELIGMVNVVREEDRGISVLAIAAVPTKSKPGDEHSHGLQYLFGLAARPVAQKGMSVDCNLHYDFTAKHFIPEVGSVFEVSDGLYGTLDATASLGDETRVELLPGFKRKIGSLGFVGAGYRFPVTESRTFDRQVILQLELGNH